jgi:SET domain-containing protein
MFVVRTSLRPSAIHGLGCYAEEPIKKGQIVWQFDPRIDIVFSPAELSSFPPIVQEYLWIHSYVEMRDGQEVFVFATDDAKYMNHADDPNLIDTPDGVFEYAARDIPAGEELTCNYFASDLTAAQKLKRIGEK